MWAVAKVLVAVLVLAVEVASIVIVASIIVASVIVHVVARSTRCQWGCRIRTPLISLTVWVPLVLAHGRAVTWLGCVATTQAAADAAEYTTREGNQDQAAYDDGNRDGNTLVVLVPVCHFLCPRATFAATVLAASATSAAGSVHKVLVVECALSTVESRGLALEQTVVAACLGFVAVKNITSGDLTLAVARCAHARNAFKSLAARVAVVLVLVLGARRLVARALLLRIAIASAGAANLGRGSKLASSIATVFVVGIADGASLELAGFGVTALVVTTDSLTTTVTFLTRLNNAVTALATSDSLDVLVIRQTVRLDVTLESRANVSDTAGRELGDVGSSGGVHHEATASVTAVLGKRTASLRIGLDRTGLLNTIVDGTKRVTSLVRKNLPLCWCIDNYVGGSNGIIRASVGS